MHKIISVAIASYNEERLIAGCFESVKDWVDEIILIDGSSSDKTVEIARKYGAKVTVTDNPKNFHINKQKAIDLCKGDWILQLDADETVPPPLKEEILAVTVNRKPQTGNNIKKNGYYIPRKNYFLGRFLTKGGQYPDYTLRLYKNRKGRLPCKDIHEQAEVEGEKGYLENPLLHYSYPDFAHYLDHFNLYTTYTAHEMRENKLKLGYKSLIKYMLLQPIYWFFLTYLRHRGYKDGFAGFTFSMFSSLRYPVSYIKYWESINSDGKERQYSR